MSLTLLNKIRGNKRAQITRLYNRVATNVDAMTVKEKNFAIARLEQHEIDIRDLDKQIYELLCEEEDIDMDAEIATCESYLERICEALVDIRGSFAPSAVNISGDNNPVRSSILKLPEMPLPKFSNEKGESLTNFISSFEGVINKHNLSTYEKFVYLKRQLSGEPLILISSLEESKQSYENGTDLLKKAFACEFSQKFEVIKRLSNLKLNYEDSPYEYVSEMRVLIDLFKSLKIVSEDVLQYFIWNGMNSGLQTQFIHICNKNKPSLDEISENIFRAVDWYKEVSERINEKKSINRAKIEKNENLSNFAAAVNYPSREGHNANAKQFCSLCTSRDGEKVYSHSTKNCPQFKTPDSKIKRLISLNSCVLCGYNNHNSKNCKYKFYKSCFTCNGDHMTFLCPKSNVNDNSSQNGNKSERKNKSESKKYAVSSGIVWMEPHALNVHIGSDTILPTFTCQVKESLLRGMKDGGCQTNFVNEIIAEKLNLPVIKSNVLINVHGFNKNRQYKTKIVKIMLNFGKETYEIHAIGVPLIRVNLKLPGLGKIVKGFLDKGYTLADLKLNENSNEICDLDLILGSNDPHVLIEEQVSIGNECKSVFSITNHGVLLYGSIDHFDRNLSYLKSINSESEVKVLSSSDLVNENDCFDKYSLDGFPCISVNTSHVVLNTGGELDEKELANATFELLDQKWFQNNYDLVEYNEKSSDENDKLVKFILDNTVRKNDGRLEMPLIWRSELAHLLGNNYNLALKILRSNLNKFRKDKSKLLMIDDVFKDQLREGVIEKIDNVESYMNENTSCSFLPHMSVFKMNNETTKCRVVFLSNLCEQRGKNDTTISHNQAMYAGPSLNQKITTALMQLRFGEKLFCYDLRKAFLQISLRPEDSNRLCFLWFRNVKKGDYSIVGYKSVRLCFGLRPSPLILMLAMYKILCLDIEDDSIKMIEVKKLLYTLLYMDNGAFAGSSEEIRWVIDNVDSIFNSYGFDLQQMVTNDREIQTDIDKCNKDITPPVVKLLGLLWDRDKDILMTRDYKLDINANTKRKILKSIAEVYDIFNFNGPTLNRARLFMHKLQCIKDLEWDVKIDGKYMNEWKNIVKQFNNSPVMNVERFIGDRKDSYRLMAFCDASRSIYATVIYIQNINTKKVNFLMAKNRLVNKQLDMKSIPSLELQAITLGVDVLLEVYDGLSGDECLCPINIEELQVYTDSEITLHWLNSYHNKLDKMQKLSVFCKNRLESIYRQCLKQPITFYHVSTRENPADCMSRAVSYSQLVKTNFINGPSFLTSTDAFCDVLHVRVPNINAIYNVENVNACQTFFSGPSVDHLIDPNKYGSFSKLIKVYSYVFKFIGNIRVKLGKKPLLQSSCSDVNFYEVAVKHVLSIEQKLHFPELFEYFEVGKTNKRDTPEMVNKLNPRIEDGLIRIHSKFDRWKDHSQFKFPILLNNNSFITKLIIRDIHEKLSHSGCYAILTELRKEFWIPKVFSTVKKVIKDCVICCRFNGRVVKINQSPYRDFRVSPESVPFRNVFIDHMGPFFVKNGDCKVKRWVLVVSCLWSRGINLVICSDLSVDSFLRALQIHIYQHGIPSKVFSDLGSQLVSGGNIITDFLKSVEITNYLQENGIHSVKFDNYFKGNSSLGSLVEICVKFAKKLMYSSIRNNILNIPDFDLLLAQTISILNKRPLTFKDYLRTDSLEDVPSPITPELLIYGRDIVAINVIPALEICDGDVDWFKTMGSNNELKKDFSKLNAVRFNMWKIYSNEFYNNLLDQSVDDKHRFKKVEHLKLAVGDIVLIKDDNVKTVNYPMAIVREVFTNEQGEVTSVKLFKGNTRELVKRHVNSVVPVMRGSLVEDTPSSITSSLDSRPVRKAAEKCKSAIKQISQFL